MEMGIIISARTVEETPSSALLGSPSDLPVLRSLAMIAGRDHGVSADSFDEGVAMAVRESA